MHIFLHIERFIILFEFAAISTSTFCNEDRRYNLYISTGKLPGTFCDLPCFINQSQRTNAIRPGDSIIRAKDGAVCTTPVPSSVVTKSPTNTLNTSPSVGTLPVSS